VSPVERVLWGTLLGLFAVVGFVLWAAGYWSAFLGQLAGLVTSPPALTPLGTTQTGGGR
jgi:ABC-type transporter Mla subunit MlaD